MLTFLRAGSLYRLAPREFVSNHTWYKPRVTETLASQIRALAAEAGYADVERYQDVPLEVRQEIKAKLGLKTIQNVNKALVQTGAPGGGKHERLITDAHRCPCCKQVFQTQLARKEAKEFLAKLLKSEA